jgi:uncharacterized membrane protein YciS (DUF1049 family)
MKLIAFAGLVIAAFVAIWFFVVIPSERQQHERKLAALQKQIEKREAAQQAEKYESPDSD